MTPEMEALGRRAVACKGWRWMPGVRVLSSTQPPPKSPAPIIVLWDHGSDCPFLRCSVSDQIRSDAIPDLSDPATLGCLLALVREATGARLQAGDACGLNEAHLVLDYPNGGEGYIYGESIAEVLVLALETAP